jgi:hypothetical protein
MDSIIKVSKISRKGLEIKKATFENFRKWLFFPKKKTYSMPSNSTSNFKTDPPGID